MRTPIERSETLNKHPEIPLDAFYDNCSPYAFNFSPTVHCRIQKEWA